MPENPEGPQEAEQRVASFAGAFKMKGDKLSYDSCHRGGGWEDTSHLTLLCGGAEVWGNLLVPERDFSPLFFASHV